MIFISRKWLVSSQNSDGGWGGTLGAESSVEETAVAVSALVYEDMESAEKGLEWIIKRFEEVNDIKPSPIGLCFDFLWYFEELFPLVHTINAINIYRSRL